MVKKLYLSETDFKKMSEVLLKKIRDSRLKFTHVLAIARGGIPLGKVLALGLGLPLRTIRISAYDGEKLRDKPIIDYGDQGFHSTEKLLVVDDLIDRGITLGILKKYLDDNVVSYKSAVLFEKPHASITADYSIKKTKAWVVFPWEQDESKPQVDPKVSKKNLGH